MANKAEKIETTTDEMQIQPRMDEKITVRSIVGWTTGAKRQTTNGDITITPMGHVLLSREEVIAQGQNGNTLLTGIDGAGSHASWYIEDDYTRQELSFDVGDTKQNFLTEDTIKKIFEYKTQSVFETHIQDSVVTRGEKYFLLATIKKLKFNDYDKIAFCEKYCGRRLDTL